MGDVVVAVTDFLLQVPILLLHEVVVAVDAVIAGSRSLIGDPLQEEEG